MLTVLRKKMTRLNIFLKIKNIFIKNNMFSSVLDMCMVCIVYICVWYKIKKGEQLWTISGRYIKIADL